MKIMEWWIWLVIFAPIVVFLIPFIVTKFEDILDFFGDLFALLFDSLIEYWYIWLTGFFVVAGIIFLVLGGISFDNVIYLTNSAKICFIIFGIAFILCPASVWLFFWWKSGWDSSSLSYKYEEEEEGIVEVDEVVDEDSDEIKTNKSKPKRKKGFELNKEKLDGFEDFFRGRIIGQEQAEQKIKTQLIHCLYDLKNNENNRPLGIFFFVGPTGVGKTEMVKTLSKYLYDSDNFNRFDMSEYKSEMATQQLLGAPNGYVGYEEGGTLINKMKKNKKSIVLFDEIEKAHSSVFDLFLQILDEGTITSNKGEKISFKYSFVIFTSNIGASQIEENMSKEQTNSIILEEINYFFTNELNRPEILGRIGKDNIIPFNMISTKEDMYKILDIYFNSFKKDLKSKKIEINFDRNTVYDFVLQDVDKTKGARDIRNEFEVFKKHFMLALFENNLDFEKLRNKTINFEYNNEKVKITNI